MPDFRHFVLQNSGSLERYLATGAGSGKFRLPPRDGRKEHGERLIVQFEKVVEEAQTKLKEEPATDGLHFIPVCFEGERGIASGKPFDGLKLESLETKDENIRVVNVREEGGRQFATVAVPRGKVEHFIKRFKEYVEKDRVRTTTDGTEIRTPRHQKLVESISDIRLAALKDYYTDSDKALPAPTEIIWWEVWLEFRGDAGGERKFRSESQHLGIDLSEQTVRFPEVLVILARTSLRQWSRFPELLNYLAELRRAKIVASEYANLEPSEQAEFIQALLDRTTYAPTDAPAVCVLDTGVNRGHPLLEQALGEEDTLAWNPKWTPGDRDGHGTEIAGVALFGPRLNEILLSDEKIILVHRLESVKIWPDDGENDPPDYGPITVGSMAKAELQSPGRTRVFCLSTTADDRDEWLPTVWSASLDQACSAAEQRRLLLVSAGNLQANVGVNYPDDNHLASVQDPSQAWNALTIGACTEMAWIDEAVLKNWTPVAPKGRLSPASTTSLSWAKQDWPVKPELVLEGGNYARDPAGFVSAADDLSLLTTGLSETGALLGTTRDTSPATAQAARMAAIIQAEYPELWPETIRGLLVHSAAWTKEMREEFPRKKTKTGLGKVPAPPLFEKTRP